MNQKQKIVKSLINGKLTVLTAMLKGLGTKLSTRIGEIEKEINVRFHRHQITKKNGDYHFEYSSKGVNKRKLIKYLK
jgi:hypothetical protein